MRALIYCRVSTDEQAGDEKHSLKTQLRLCENAIENSDVFRLAEDGVYNDPGRSATNMRRPGLQDLLIRAKEDKSIGAIFVQDTDRIARNVNDHLTIKTLLQASGVVLISVSQPGLEDTPEGNLMDLLIAGMNQFQSQLTGRKTTKSLEQKFSDGWWPTLAPIGYLNTGHENDPSKRIITLDEERAPFIKKAFKMYAAGGYSMIEIRDMLYKKGFVTKVGKRVALSKMEVILRSHFYYGEMRWKGMVKKGNHKPIISKSLFNRCQKIRAKNNRYACRRRKHNFLLRGFVFCAICDQRHTAEHHFKKNKSYYHCNRAGDQIKCNDKYVEVKDLEKQVAEKFKEIQFSEEFIEKVIRKTKKLYELKKSGISKQKQSFVTSKLNFEKKLETAEEKLISGVLSDAGFERAKIRYRERIENIEDEIHKLERSKNLKIDIIQSILALIRNIGGAYEKAPYELKRIYLGLFWEHFKVSNKEITKSIKSPIVIALKKIGSINFLEKQKSASKRQTNAIDDTTTKDQVIITSVLGERRDSNSRPLGPQPRALPTELRPP